MGEAGIDVPWLLFTDADVDWHPDLIRSALALAEERDADVVGLLPTLRFGSAGEAIVQIQLALALAIFFPIERAMDPEPPRHPHRRGVHPHPPLALRHRRRARRTRTSAGEIVEDLALGKTLKAAGEAGFASPPRATCSPAACTTPGAINGKG